MSKRERVPSRRQRDCSLLYLLSLNQPLKKSTYRLKPKHKDAATEFAQAAKRIGILLTFTCRYSSCERAISLHLPGYSNASTGSPDIQCDAPILFPNAMQIYAITLFMNVPTSCQQSLSMQPPEPDEIPKQPALHCLPAPHKKSFAPPDCQYLL